MIIGSEELLGQTIGSCTLQRLIGRGGMGAVYLAQQTRPRRPVAIKVLMPSVITERRPRMEFLKRFRREADAIAALDHVHIMPIYEYGEREELAYLVMPYITGGTLRDRLAERGTLPLAEIVPIIQQAAAALDCAHAQNIIHRDLKPGNILFHADGRVLLADFGLAKVLHDVTGMAGQHISSLTSVGTVVGTPEYLSPEQGAGNPIDRRSDVYSLGIVLFQALVGHVPFTGASPVATALKHKLEAPPSPCALNPAIPGEVEEVVMKALAKQPDERFATTGDLAHALHDAFTASQNASQPRLTLKVRVFDDLEVGLREDLAAVSKVTTLPMQEAVQVDGARESSVGIDEKTVPTLLPSPNAFRDACAHTARTQPQEPVTAKHAARRGTTDHLQKDEITAPLPKGPTGSKKPGAPRNAQHPIMMMLFGSLVTLLLLGVVWLASSHLSSQRGHSSVPDLINPPNHFNSTPAPTVQPVYTPAPTLVPAGSFVYAARLPGKPCDDQGGTWSQDAGVVLHCSSAGTEMTNQGTGHPAGLFLTALPRSANLRTNYVLQVQADIKPGSHGQFGVFFRYQQGASQREGFSFLLDPSGSWQAVAYDPVPRSSTLLVQLPTRGSLAGKITLDIVVQGDTFTFYLNGVEQGHAVSDEYANGCLGLAVDVGADVVFSDVQVHKLPGEG